MDRLLSKQEKEQFRVLEKEGTNDIDNMLQSQLSKGDKWWVEQMQIQQGICHTHRCEFDHKVCDFCGATCNWWQSLKQSILNAGKN